jgi:hypothetical protein
MTFDPKETGKAISEAIDNHFKECLKERKKPDKDILLFFHCKNCMKNKPNNQSPQDWSRVECGWTTKGIKVRCIRCEKKIVHLDFMGQKVNTI